MPAGESRTPLLPHVVNSDRLHWRGVQSRSPMMPRHNPKNFSRPTTVKHPPVKANANQSENGIVVTHLRATRPTCRLNIDAVKRCMPSGGCSSQSIRSGGAGDEPHEGVPHGHDANVGYRVCEDGHYARTKDHPLRKGRGIQIISGWAQHRNNSNEHGQPVPPESASHPPSDEVDWRACNSQSAVEEEGKIRRCGKRYLPPPEGFAQCD